MNIILNTSCNKKCSFCFARDVIDDYKEVDVDFVRYLVDKSESTRPIKLLGGEPTMAKNFFSILDYLETVENPVTLISNFLFNDKTLDKINSFTSKKDTTFLINVSELNNAQERLTLKNLKNLNSSNHAISIGFTPNLSYGFEYYEYILNTMVDNVREKIGNIRISLPMPNKLENNDMYFYKNYGYVDMFKNFIKWSNKNEIEISLDCGVYPCMFENINDVEYFQNNLNNFKFGCNSNNSVPGDVLSDGTVRYCYPGYDTQTNIYDHDKMEFAFNNLAFQYKLKISDKDKIPQTCNNCEFFLKSCSGPCLGFVK